ncbi:type I restriction endonuclease subunit R [Thermocrinis minervae]|uniref:Type I restriction enzyme endonuclease subunit n=1 Tax=Thermocrinis minervae TaxID=381751 RepID=A0A1M6STB3_9AQUI|nr:HsdR family type I site-specific deoxyribonuclease [Thermocrinis minervae]SHK47929.1 type I restriction enzyme, R subunit [Thermocrinis minervae]
MSRGFGAERHSVQEPIIEYAKEIGWQYVPPEEALKLRGDNTKLIFKDIFIKKILELNPFLTEDLAYEVIKKLERLRIDIEGNLTALEYLKGLKNEYIKQERRERNIRLIDIKNIHNNVFHVTDEFEFNNGKKTIRPDIVFLINGIPIVLVETKATYVIEGMNEALDQIRRYHEECPELLAISQIYVISNLVKFSYGATWNTSARSLSDWRLEESSAEPNFEQIIKTFFNKEYIIKLITDYILFTRKDGELQKVVLRPHQIRAVEKIIQRAKDPEKRRGLIWHTQGSGKTYTMIVAAQKILKDPAFENPTVIMLVDRNELEAQLFNNIKAVGIENVEVAESKKHLKELLQSDRRGLIVTMIHKFDNMPPGINKRENIFVLVDEAHRSTSGKLGNHLMSALPNATYIGFTGTPIDKTSHGNSTFITFGINDPPKGYLDKYSIAESIKDGTTVQLHYTLVQNDLRVDKEILEREFLAQVEAEGISDIETLNKILKRAVTLKNMLKNKDRIKKVAEYVAKHYKEFVAPMGYKAFLVAVDREACALYKEELDKHLPPEYSQVVYSKNNNDPPELKKYHLSKEKEKIIRKNFTQPDKDPKILIVTDKLLTGFDAPILYCMYLDKPMRDHVLLQAIARVNRPYEDKNGIKKPCGLIVDFVGIFENLEKALLFDSSDIEGMVKDIELLKEEFVKKMEQARNEYIALIKEHSKDKAVEAAVEYFRDEERRNKYYQFFKELQSMYEILSPDPSLGNYIDDYYTLSKIYWTLKEKDESQTMIDKELARKTAELVRKHTSTDKIDPTNEIYRLDGKTLTKLQESQTSEEDIADIFNMIKSQIEQEKLDLPSSIRISISERADEIAKLFERNQKESLEKLIKLYEDVNQMKVIHQTLIQKNIGEPENIISEIKRIMDKYPYWDKSEDQERKLRREIYEVLFNIKTLNEQQIKDIVSEIINNLKQIKQKPKND